MTVQVSKKLLKKEDNRRSERAEDYFTDDYFAGKRHGKRHVENRHVKTGGLFNCASTGKSESLPDFLCRLKNQAKQNEKRIRSVLFLFITFFLLSEAINLFFCSSFLFNASLQAAETVSAKTSSETTSSAKTSTTSLTDALDHPELQAGLEAWMTGDLKNCERLIRMACDKEPNLSPPPIILALLYSNAGKYSQMREYLESAIEEYPEDPESYLQLAGINFRENHHAETKLLLEKVRELFAKYEAKSEKEKINNGERLNYLRHEFLSLQASLANKKKNIPEAERLIRQLLVTEPNNDETLASLGYLLFLQDKMDESEKILDQAHAINKDRLPGWLAQAHMLENCNKTEDAQKLINARFTPESTRYDLVPSVVRLLMKWNRMNDAEKYIVKLQKEAGNLISTWIISGEYALYKHQYHQAEEAFQRAVLMDPGNSEAVNGLALALADQSNKSKLKTALETAKRNWTHNPDSTDYKVTYAWILFLSGNKDEANAFFSPMLESGKITQTTAYYLAEIANVRDDQSLALNLLDIALEPKTNFPKREAAEELRKLLDKKKE